MSTQNWQTLEVQLCAKNARKSPLDVDAQVIARAETLLNLSFDDAYRGFLQTVACFRTPPWEWVGLSYDERSHQHLFRQYIKHHRFTLPSKRGSIEKSRFLVPLDHPGYFFYDLLGHTVYRDPGARTASLEDTGLALFAFIQNKLDH